MSQEPRQPPSFVPTLTHMVAAAPTAKAEPATVALSAMPAAFAELLKDWPVLGEPVAPAEQAPPGVFGQEKNRQDGNAEHHAERVAQRAEALVLQRLPPLLAGLISQAVRDALAEAEADPDRQPKLE